MKVARWSGVNAGLTDSTKYAMYAPPQAIMWAVAGPPVMVAAAVAVPGGAGALAAA